jgi:two-component system phosphate regulon response regulator PhoB
MAAKVLLVEDDANLRDIYFARFQAEGYDLSVAANGEEALAMTVKVKPDLMILDVMMPRISGFDVLDIVRSTPDTAGTKVIMMTALSEESDRSRGRALGVDEYLVKSQVTLEDVVATAKRVLGTATSAAAVAPAEPTPPTPTPAA